MTWEPNPGSFWVVDRAVYFSVGIAFTPFSVSVENNRFVYGCTHQPVSAKAVYRFWSIAIPVYDDQVPIFGTGWKKPGLGI